METYMHMGYVVYMFTFLPIYAIIKINNQNLL